MNWDPRECRTGSPLDRLGPLLIAATALGCWMALLGAGGEGPVGFPLDDAWIHLVYARSLALGDGLAYNPGVPSAGDTAPLWALLLAVPSRLAAGDLPRLVLGVQALGLVAHVATAILASRLARPGGAPLALVAGLAVATSPALLAAAASGMEVSLAAALLLGAVAAAQRGRAGVWGGAVGLLLAVRPEAALAAGVGLVPLWRARGSAALLRASPGPLLVGAALATWNVHATGRPLPATFYAKAQPAGVALLGRVGTAIVDFLPQASPLWGWGLLVAAAGVRLATGQHGRLPLAAGALFVAANVAVIAPYDAHAFYHLRYLLPAVPALTVAGLVGLAAIGARLAGEDGARRTRAERACALLGAAIALVGVGATWGPVVSTFHASVRNIAEVQVRLGQWLGEQLPAGAWIAANDAGAIRYFSERPVVDVMGLNTPEFLDDAAWREAHPVHAAVLIVPEWFRPEDPEAVRLLARAVTEDYRVTGFPGMAQQLALGCVAPGALRFAGIREISIACVPWAPQR